VRVAAVDLGTNTTRLLVADVEHGRITGEVERLLGITRLGDGVDTSGRLSDEAMERVARCVAEYAGRARELGSEPPLAVATSAVRDAENGDEFLDAAGLALGVRPELLSGDEEARLSFRGATADIAPQEGPFLIIDLGGGSTVLVLGESEPEAAVSLQLGCVRMTERHLKSDPPTSGELAACVADVRRTLKGAHIDASRAKTFVGLAGTVTALAGMQLGLRAYDASRTHHSLLTLEQVEAAFQRLSSLDVASRRPLLAQPERAEVIVGGAAVLATLLRHFDIRTLRVSEHDILDGLAARLR